jgi:hypothetical protein
MEIAGARSGSQPNPLTEYSKRLLASLESTLAALLAQLGQMGPLRADGGIQGRCEPLDNPSSRTPAASLPRRRATWSCTTPHAAGSFGST